MSHQTIERESVGKLSLQFLFSAKNKINAEIKIKKNAAETIACETTPLGNTSLYSTGIQTHKKIKVGSHISQITKNYFYIIIIIMGIYHLL